MKKSFAQTSNGAKDMWPFLWQRAEKLSTQKKAPGTNIISLYFTKKCSGGKELNEIMSTYIFAWIMDKRKTTHPIIIKIN